MQHFEPMMMIHVCRTLILLKGFVNRKRTFDTFPLKILLSLCWMYKISESSVELLSLLLNMFDFGEGPTTRASIRGAKIDPFPTPMKYITRAVLHRASQAAATRCPPATGDASTILETPASHQQCHPPLQHPLRLLLSPSPSSFRASPFPIIKRKSKLPL